MKFLTHILVAVLCAACGDTVKKGGDRTNNVNNVNNVNNANNQNNRNNLDIDTSNVDWTPAEQAFCQRWGGGIYECTTQEDFTITAVLNDCERIRREQLAVCEYFTAETFEPCLEEIDSCSGTNEPFEQNCTALTDCINDFAKLAENSENNVNSRNNVNNLNNLNSQDQPSAEFRVVAAILTENCGFGPCHGSVSGSAWGLPSDTASTPLDVYDALVNQPSSTSTTLVVPGDSESSEVWRRLNLETFEPQFMPLGGTPLQEEEYIAIQAWIDNGANY